MVPPSSHGVSRVPRYFGYSSLILSFAYVTLTLFGWPSHAIRLTAKVLKAVHTPEGEILPGYGPLLGLKLLTEWHGKANQRG